MARKRRRDTSEVSCCVKYLMFGFNVLFWLLGAAVCAIGLWAWTEKDTFKNIGRLTNVALDPAMMFIITGGVMFIIGFAGCVGALRENTKLLMFLHCGGQCTCPCIRGVLLTSTRTIFFPSHWLLSHLTIVKTMDSSERGMNPAAFCVCVGLIFFFELIIGILAFVYKNWVKHQIESQLNNMIINYRDDPDLQNLVDWVQRDWLNCCGVNGYKDWEQNIYFNCTSPGREACGVPFSCCRPTNEVMENRHCGFDMMKPAHNFDRGNFIYTEGCIPAGERWLERNLIPVASVAVSIAVLQILGICFAHNLRSDIQAQRSKWRM